MADSFSAAVARKALARVAFAEGYGAVDARAASTLTELLILYLRQVSVRAKERAVLGCRSDVNLLDVLGALGELGVQPEQLVDFVSRTPAIPFGRGLLPYPLHRVAPPAPAMMDQGDWVKRPKHVPAFLPPPPPNHTFQHTSEMPPLGPGATAPRKVIAEASRAAAEGVLKIEEAAVYDVRAVTMDQPIAAAAGPTGSNGAAGGASASASAAAAGPSAAGAGGNVFLRTAASTHRAS